MPSHYATNLNLAAIAIAVYAGYYVQGREVSQIERFILHYLR